MRASAGAKSHATRDSATGNLAEYSIDVELSDNNKKMLEAFKQSSGFYNVSPKKNKGNNNSPQKPTPTPSPVQPAHKVPPAPIIVSPIDSSECPRIYLFGNNFKNSTPASKLEPSPSPLESKATTPFPLTLTATKQSTVHAHNNSTTSTYYNSAKPLTLTSNNNNHSSAALVSN